jgi:hypothetical protein
MDEFKKPFEYFEEKGIGGILLVLFFMLISLEPLLGILSLAVGYNVYPDSKIFISVFVTISIVYISFALLSGIALKKLYRFAVAGIKVFLLFRLIYLVPVLIINMRFEVATIPFQKTYFRYAIEYNSIMQAFTLGMLYVVTFSIGWFIYLVMSKKVRELFLQKKSGLNISQSSK